MKNVQEETKAVSLQEKLNELFMDRINDPKETMSEDIYCGYEKAQKEFHEIYRKLQEILPESGNELLFDLDSVIGNMLSLQMGSSYNLGLKDGIELANGVELSRLDFVLRPVAKKLKRVK